MWELITIFHQWTPYTAKVVEMISLNVDIGQEYGNIDYTEIYPFHLNDGAVLPTDSTGFVYCLVSEKYRDQIYIGQTACLCQRLIQHNSGSGSLSTENIRFRPWAVAAYICGLGHMSTVKRMGLEQRWKLHIEDLQVRGQQESLSWINIGSHIVQMYNSGSTLDKIRYV